MNTHRAAAAFFIVICLGLCGLVMHRQISAHPLSPQVDRQAFSTGRPDWHPAKDSVTREAKATVRGQLDAFRSGDGEKAMTFQSRDTRRLFGDPRRFEKMIVARYPEFGHCHSAKFESVWSDQAGDLARAQVIVQGENGHRVEGEYLMVRQDGRLRIQNIQSWPLPNE